MRLLQKHRHQDPRAQYASGFTLIEVGIIVPILILMTLVIVDALFVMLRTSVTDRGKVDITYEAQAAITNIESSVVLGSLFIPTVDSGLNDPYPPAVGSPWTYTGTSSSSRVLLVRAYSTNGNPLSTGRQPVYIGNPAGSECNSTNIYFNTVLQNNLVFFVKNGNLYRRRLVDTATLTCNSQYQKLSCPSLADLAAQGIGTRSSSCGADDELLAKDVSSFTIQYYDSKTSTTPLDVYAVGADSTLVTTATDVEISLTISRKASGETLSQTSSLRMSKLNSKAD